LCELRVVRDESNLLGDTYTATLKFRVWDPSGRKGGNVEGKLRYRRSAQAGMLSFLDFTATSFERSGAW
jgi:hypothetical protein